MKSSSLNNRLGKQASRLDRMKRYQNAQHARRQYTPMHPLTELRRHISGSYRKENQFPVMENCVNFKFNDQNDLEKKVKELNSNGKVYAVIIEPYSASLLTPCSEEFLNKLNELKNKFGFRVIFDEVFTGWYKSEKLFYFENFRNEIHPDAITFSKALGGGKSSISCVVVNDDLYNLAYGRLSETFLHTTT